MAIATKRADRAVSVQADGVRSPVAGERLAELARRSLGALRVSRAMLSITLVTPRAMAALNREHLGHRGATDVITFALGADPAGVIVADIYICPDIARAQAKRHGVGVREEIARLVIHGTLHACGWDHPTDDGRMTSPMWQRQEALLRRFWHTATPAT
jgi:probable rRNA maturation factor